MQIYWGGEENLDLKRKKQAEFLIKNDLPKEVIIKYICYDEKSKKKLISFGVSDNYIEVNQNAYY